MFTNKMIDGNLELKFIKKQKTKILGSNAQEYIFGIYLTDADSNIGLIKLRPKLNSELEEYGGHIEYEVNEKYRGNNYAARSCILLFPLMKKLNIDPIIYFRDPTPKIYEEES